MARRETEAPRLVRRSGGEEAALYIRKLIFRGELRPGDRVPQDRIAKALGISRIPVREALISLENSGWVSLELHRGAFVNALDERAVRDHYELYGMVYGFAASRALERSGPGLSGLVTRLAELSRAIKKVDDPAEVYRITIDFHEAITGAARSPRVDVLVRALSNVIPGNFFALVPKAINVEQSGLGAISRAMAAGDGERAAEAYMQMMRRQGNNVVAVLRDRGVLEPVEA